MKDVSLCLVEGCSHVRATGGRYCPDHEYSAELVTALRLAMVDPALRTDELMQRAGDWIALRADSAEGGK